LSDLFLSPVETKGYALIRNLFAAMAVGIIVFRTATAVLQVQNKIDIRMKTKECSEYGYQRMPYGIQLLTVSYFLVVTYDQSLC
jgi:hypothetical protein